MSVELEILQRLRITETVIDDFISAAQDTLQRDAGKGTVELDDGTTPDVEDYAIFELALSGGAGSINLAALPHNHGGVNITKDFTGKKIRAWLFWTPDTNANNITITKGASNGYSPVGTSFTKVIPPNGASSDDFDTAAIDVASGARLLDVTGTGSQVVFCAIVCG